MAKKLRVGLIGLGSICQGGHIPGWLAADGCEIVAGADPSPGARESTQRRAGLGADLLFEDYAQMLAQVELDVVDICTPQKLHVKPALDAFKVGCHVLVEKPMATSSIDVRKMIAAAQAADRLLMVGQSMRFTENHLALKRWVDAGLVGEVYWGRASWLRSRGVPVRPSFLLSQFSAGGPTYDIGVHVLDLSLWLMGHPEPVSVSANTWLKIANKPSLMKHDPKMYELPEDLAVGLIRFANGACISLEASWALNSPELDTWSVMLAGTEGGIVNNPPTLVREEAGILTNTYAQVNPDAGTASHTAQIVAFAEAIRKGLPSPVPGEQALITQRILDGVYKSARQGREVKV